MADTEDDEYEIPVRDQRYFGAGIKRKRIQFVPSTSNEAAIQRLPSTPSQPAADQYLAIVFKDTVPSGRVASAPHATSANGGDKSTAIIRHDEDVVDGVNLDRTCDICGRPVTAEASARTHETSIAHQICLQHSHPPSHIDRKRRGLAVLESQGWDPDGRRGLGMQGEGILHPIKAKENPLRAGLGVNLADLKAKPVKLVGLDAGKVRSMEKAEKKKAERLRNAFYRSEDMEKYLGGEGETNENLDLNAFKRARRR